MIPSNNINNSVFISNLNVYIIEMRHKFLYNEEEIIFTEKGVCAVGTHSIIKALGLMVMTWRANMTPDIIISDNFFD